MAACSVEENTDHMLIRYSSNSREISVIITPTDSNILEEGNVSSVEIRGDNDLHYLLSYERDDRHIVIHASSQDRCEIPYSDLLVISDGEGHCQWRSSSRHPLSTTCLC